MKILKLESKNIKRLQAVEITPEGNVVMIGGQNAQGKSSVLDSIAYALGGKRAVCDRPVREGQDKARVVCELEDLVVTRTFTQAGGGNLTVSNRDGAKFASPQKILDKLTGKLTFDPLEFCRMEPKAQLEALKGLVGLDFSEQDQKRQALYDERTQVNREIKRAKGSLEAMPAYDEVPAQEVSVSGLMAELKDRQEQNRQNQAKREELTVLEGRITKGREHVSDIERQIDELKAKLESWKGQLQKLEQSRETLRAEIASLSDNNEQEVMYQIENAQEVNSKIQANQARAKVEKELDALDTKAQKLTREIQDIDHAKAKALHEASFPVDGLSFDESGVLLNGFPFSQSSQAEQLRVSVAMGFAMNPQLKVLLVRDGSVLDEQNMGLIAEMAQKHDGQVWIERVGEEKSCAVVIQDGSVKQ